jgi:hypothetical protein
MVPVMTEGLPVGLTPTRSAIPYKLDAKETRHQGVYLDGYTCRDYMNTVIASPNQGIEIRATKLMGRITSAYGATGLFSNSIIDTLSAAITGASTTILPTMAVGATANDIVSKIYTRAGYQQVGTTGSYFRLKITGPPTANGVVRSLVATPSGVAGNTGLTIAALGVNDVQTITPVANLSAGTYTITFTAPNGKTYRSAPLAYTATAANIQTAIDTMFGADYGDGNIVVKDNAGSTTAGLDDGFVTFTGAVEFAGMPLNQIQIDLSAATAGGGLVWSQTTTGVDGRFVAGSFIQPYDGSEYPRGIFEGDGNGYSIRMVDQDMNASNREARIIVQGHDVLPASILEWPTDTSLQAWIKAWLRAYGMGYSFRDDFSA